MTTESSSLLFGVRTSEAVASLELLQRELDKTLQKFQAISASGPAKFAGAEAEAVAAAKTLNAELKAQARTIDQAGKAMEGASKQTVRFSKRIGEATTSMSFALGESASEVKKWEKTVADAMNDPKLAIGAANFAEQRKKAVSDLLSFEDSQRKKYMASLRKDIEDRSAVESQNYKDRVAQARAENKQYWADQETNRARELAALKADIQSRSSIEAENSKIRTAQARSANKQYWADQEANRARELAALKADIQSRSAIEAENLKIRTAEARSANKQYWTDQEASRARELAALKADILARSKESAEAEKVRLAQAKAANSKYIADEEAARKAELASMRAHITEKLRLQATEQELRARFAEKSLAQQVSTLERIERRIAATGMDSAVARYGSYAVGRRSALAEMQAELNAINETAKAEKRLAAEKIASASASERASKSIQQNTEAMRDAHSVARGLSGSLGALWMTYGALVPLLAGAAIGGAAAQTFNVGKDIEYRLKMMEALGQEAVKVGQMMDAVNSSMKTPLEGAQALQVLGQAGLTTSESLAALSTTLQLATLGEMDVAEAALTLTSALATFKIEANESAKVGDLFAKAATMSNASVQDLAESLKQAGAGAATYGITLEETVAMLATLAQSGIKASAAGTAIKNATQELYAPTEKAARVMKQIGLEIYDTDGKARNYIEILKDLKRITIEMDQESRNNLIGALFNERSRRAIQIMMNDMSGLQKMLEGVAESAGYLARANDLLLNTVEGASNRFQSVLQQSYTEAFTVLNPLIRQTIASMEEFVGSDTFIGGITATGNAIAGLTTFVSDNIKVIALLAGTYLAARGSVAAYSAVVAAKTALVQGSAAATFAATGAINRETAAIAANTVATNASTAAKAANTATTVTYTSRASAAIAAVSSFARVFGILGMVLGTAGLALSAMTGSMKDIGTQSDVTVTKVQSVTEAIRQQINAIRERNRQELMRMGLKDETDAGNLQALRDRRDSLDQEAVAAKQKLDDLNSQFAAKTQELLNSRMGGAIRESRNEELKAIREQTAEYERLQAAAQEARKTLEEGESTRVEGEKLYAFNEQYQRLTNLRAQMSQIRDEAMIATDKQEIKGYLAPVEQQLEAVNDLIVQASRNSELSENKVNELMTTWGGLNAKIEETRKNAFKMEDTSGGMGGAIKLFNERFNQQKKLAEDMRDFQLKMLEEERKVGLVSTQESAEGRERIWAEYLEKMVQAGQIAQAQIGASGAKEAQKEFGARSIAQKVAAERDRAEQDLTQAQIMEAFKDQREALMSYHNLRMEFWRVEQDVLKDQKDMQEEVAKRYMSARDIAILDARNKAEEKYKKLLEDRQALLEKGLRTNPDFKQTEGGKKLLEAIEKIKQEAPKAGQAMADMAAVLYDKTTSATDGAIRALQTYADQAQDASTQVEQAFTKAFGGIEDALVDLVTKGKADFKSLIKALQADFARLAIRQYITGPLAQSAAGMLGGSAGRSGGSSGSQQQGGVDAMGLARGAKGLYDSYGTGSYGVTDMLYSAGEKMGSYAVQNFAAGMAGYMPSAIGSGVAASLGSGAAGTLMTSMPAGAATTFSASLGSGGASSMAGAAGSAVASALPYVGALYAASQGQYGAAAGMAIGTAILPGIGTAIGAVVGTIADSFLNEEPKTRHGQWEWADMTGGDWSMKYRDSRQPAGTGDAITQYARSAVDSANSMFDKLGVNAAIEHFFAITNSSLKGDLNGVASGGSIRAGDSVSEFGLMGLGGDRTKYGYGGWSEEEMLPRLQTDIQLSILQAFQTQVDSLPGLLADMIRGVNIRGLDAAGAQALTDQFNAIIQGVDNFRTAVESLPFENLKNLSFNAAANLIQFAGGLENLNAGLNTYYENFYSEVERYETAIGNLDKALSGVGVELPKMVGSADEMKAMYRSLVEAQDLTTEAGQKAYAMLIQSSGAFAELATYAGQAAAAVEAQQRASAERRDVIAARRAIEKAQQEAFEASLKAYEEGAKPFEELRATLMSAGDAAGLLGATLERAFANPLGTYSYGGNDYKLPRWEADTTAAGFNFAYGQMQMRLSRMLSDEVSANALRIENAGAALRDLSPNLGRYSPVVGPMAQVLTNAVVEASGDIGYAVRDSVFEAMMGVAQRDAYSEFASQGPGLADIRYAQQQAQWVSQVSYTPGFGMQYGADVGAYADALDKLTGRMKSGQITADQFDSAVEKLNKTMPEAVELLGDTEAQLARIEAAAQAVAMAGARSIDHYFGSLRQMAQELEKTEEPVNIATAAIGRMNSWVSAFGESARVAGGYSSRTGEAALIADAAGIAASVLTTADARKAAEALAKDAAFSELGGAELRDMSLLVDGIRAFDPTSWENAFIRISDALGQGAITQDQYAALFNYSLDVFEDTANATEQVTASFERLRDAAKSLADELLVSETYTTLTYGQQLAEAQRQYDEAMRRARGGDDSADIEGTTRNLLDIAGEGRDEVAYRRTFARAVNDLRGIERIDTMKDVADEVRRLNNEVAGLRADLREANAQIAANTGKTVKRLDRIIVEDTAV